MRRPSSVALACLLGAALAIGSAAGCRRAARTEPGALVDAGALARSEGALPPPDGAPPGALLYDRYCALCHGADAEGYAADNAPALRNPAFLASASDSFLRAGIERGRPGTAMGAYGAAYGGPLAPADVTAVIGFLRRDQPAPLGWAGRVTSGRPADGEKLYDARCAECHGTRTQRGDAVHLFNPVLLETASDAFLRSAITRGRPGTRMPAWAGRLDDGQIDDLVAFFRSLAPAPAPPAPTSAPVPPPKGPIVLHPGGKAPEFHLREERFLAPAELAKALEQKRRVVIVDARAPSEWDRLHITGAISIPYYDMHGIDLVPNDGTWVVAYCACPHHASGVVVDELRRRGFQHTAVMDDGIYAWQRAGYPVVAADGSVPAMSPAPPGSGSSAAANRGTGFAGR